MPSKLTRENCEAIFREFAKDFRKHNKSLPDTEIVIVGGGSILLNYS